MKMLPQPSFGREMDHGGRRGEIGLVAATMAILSLVLYARTFGADWTYDDWMVIVKNPDVQSWSGFFADTYPGRPLRELTFLLDHSLFGLKPAAWHAQNILWHGLSAFLTWLLILRLGAGRTVAWGTALIFLFHPLNVEAVASLSHRKESLALAFSLLALLAWLHSYVVVARPWRWRLGALLLWLVALQAKQIVVGLPLLLVVWEVCALPAEKRWLLRWPRLCGLASIVAGLGFLCWFWLGNGVTRYGERAFDFLVRWQEYNPDSVQYYPAMVLKSWAFMASRLVWPSPLAVEYFYPVPHSYFDPWVLAGVVLVLAYGALLVLTWGLDRRHFFGLAWFGLFWLPTSNIWPLAYFSADRYFYMPALGLFFCAALLMAEIPGPPWRRWCLLLLLLGPLAGMSWLQVRHWDNDETLYLHALKVSPQSAYICNELGKYYDTRGEMQKAFAYYRRGQQIDPREGSLPYNLGVLFERRGLTAQALEYYRLFLSMEHRGEYAEVAGELRRRLQTTYGGIY